MIVHGMTIRLYLTMSEQTDMLFRSPEHRKSSGWRMRIGWNILRIGAWIMFGKKWAVEIK